MNPLEHLRVLADPSSVVIAPVAPVAGDDYLPTWVADTCMVILAACALGVVVLVILLICDWRR